MKKYSSNLAFIDLLFNMLVGFTCLFIISFLLINPIAKKGLVDPPVKLMVEARWGDESKWDVDLWAKSPNSLVGYPSKESGYVTLSRDDLGKTNDTYTVNGITKVVKRNYEVVNLTDLPDGEYVINVHMFSAQFNEKLFPINIRVVQIQPYRVIYEDNVYMDWPKQERTAVSFNVVNGKIRDINTMVQQKIRTKYELGVP